MWYRVEAPYMCCGIEERDGTIINAAPIMRWAIGKSLTSVSNWIYNKGYKIEPLQEHQDGTEV